MFDYTKHLDGMPREQYVALLSIAKVLWHGAWIAEGNHGKPPTLAELSLRNRKRWFGAAVACNNLIAQALQDTVHQDTVINNCIKALEALKGPVSIK